MGNTANSITLFQYPPCSTCRSAVKWLKTEGWDVQTIHIVEQPPTVEQLRQLIPASGLDIGKWFNTSGEVYREMKLKDKMPHLSETEKLELLASNGMLIKRPIATDGVRVTIGFKPELYAQAWGVQVTS